jgi:proteasome lid subunit RPN8/RPN11
MLKSGDPGWEYCGLIYKTGEGAYEITGPVTSEKNDTCAASMKLEDEIVGYYHAHPANQGDNFSHDDRDNAEDKRWSFFLINAKRGMTRYIPAGDVYRAGKVKDLGIAPDDC